jgi:hypothetical protein
VFAYLPNRKRIVARISEVYDKDLFKREGVYLKTNSKYIAEAKLTAIYDDFSQELENGINTFPIIGSDVFALPHDIYRRFLSLNSRHSIEIGTSFLDSSIQIIANPDILFGKHLGIFGNTGTGKSCTVASIIQGIKRRLKDKDDKSVTVSPKIIIFDANDEYSKAFDVNEFKVKVIPKSELHLPHNALTTSEYFKLLEASQGVQAPVLRDAIDTLNKSKPNFSLEDLQKGLDASIKNKAGSNYNMWLQWCATMNLRLQKILDDTNINSVINSKINTVQQIFTDYKDYEIIIIHADFNKNEIDIITFLFSKLIYQYASKKRTAKQNMSLLLVFEEAHRYINDEDKEDYKLGNHYIERLAREGRKFGISLIISSQRPSELSKTVLSQCNSYIIHRITNKNDLDFIGKTLSVSNSDILKVVSGLERQYAVVIGEAFAYSDIVKIETANPTTDSDDPEVIQNWLMSKKVNLLDVEESDIAADEAPPQKIVAKPLEVDAPCAIFKNTLEGN